MIPEPNRIGGTEFADAPPPPASEQRQFGGHLPAQIELLALP